MLLFIGQYTYSIEVLPQLKCIKMYKTVRLCNYKLPTKTLSLIRNKLGKSWNIKCSFYWSGLAVNDNSTMNRPPKFTGHCHYEATMMDQTNQATTPTWIFCLWANATILQVLNHIFSDPLPEFFFFFSYIFMTFNYLLLKNVDLFYIWSFFENFFFLSLFHIFIDELWDQQLVLVRVYLGQNSHARCENEYISQFLCAMNGAVEKTQQVVIHTLWECQKESVVYIIYECTQYICVRS